MKIREWGTVPDKSCTVWGKHSLASGTCINDASGNLTKWGSVHTWLAARAHKPNLQPWNAWPCSTVSAMSIAWITSLFLSAAQRFCPLRNAEEYVKSSCIQHTAYRDFQFLCENWWKPLGKIRLLLLAELVSLIKGHPRDFTVNQVMWNKMTHSGVGRLICLHDKWPLLSCKP